MGRLCFSYRAHALAAMRDRGVSASEVERTVAEGDRRTAKLGRLRAEKTFPFKRSWLGQDYAWKKVRVIFEEQDGSIDVMTVISFFF